ncbi:hypothetical protein Dimus_011410 [Dionaea muscipula]
MAELLKGNAMADLLEGSATDDAWLTKFSWIKALRFRMPFKVDVFCSISADTEGCHHALNCEFLEKLEHCMASLAEMEKRAIMAESILEATLQYQSGQNKAISSPRTSQDDSLQSRNNQELSSDQPPQRFGLLARPVGLGLRDKNKVLTLQGKASNTEDMGDAKLVL